MTQIYVYDNIGIFTNFKSIKLQMIFINILLILQITIS
jgi:hypothetical protein